MTTRKNLESAFLFFPVSLPIATLPEHKHACTLFFRTAHFISKMYTFY